VQEKLKKREESLKNKRKGRIIMAKSTLKKEEKEKKIENKDPFEEEEKYFNDDYQMNDVT
jgi:hypothetical protein